MSKRVDKILADILQGDITGLLHELSTGSREDQLDLYREIGEVSPRAGKVLRKNLILPMYAREYSPFGYKAFYELVLDLPMPRHVMPWVQAMFDAVDQGLLGVIIMAFRGATKSTALSAIYTAFLTGNRSHGSSLIIRANDQKAQQTSAKIARIISVNKGWKLAFPDIVPAKNFMTEEMGVKPVWGAKSGYELFDMRYQGRDGDEGDFEDWVQKRFQDGGDENPSIIGMGIGNGGLIGSHPTNALAVDDLHNRKNSADGQDFRGILDTVKSDIYPMAVPGLTKAYYACTPWREDDAYHMAMETGRYLLITTPIYKVVDVDEKGDDVVNYKGKRVRLAWPEVYTVEEITAKEKESNTDFPRMYLVDLKQSKGQALPLSKISYFPHGSILPRFITVIGVDYTSTIHPKDPRRDYFALAVGKIIPGERRVVLVEGFVGRLTQGGAEQKLIAYGNKYHDTLRMVTVEAIRESNVWAEFMLRTTNLPIEPIRKGISIASKGRRFEKFMLPLFEQTKAMVTDKGQGIENPEPMDFITRFVQEWGDYPNGRYDDTLDAVAYMCFAARPWILVSDPDDDKAIGSLTGEKEVNELAVLAGIGRR